MEAMDNILVKQIDEAATQGEVIIMGDFNYPEIDWGTETCSSSKESIITGSVPQDWRIANVVPIFKKGTKTELGNYRPVSLTSTVGKILEGILRDAILEYLKRNNLMTQYQHGFTRDRSCQTNLISFYEEDTFQDYQEMFVQFGYVVLFSSAFPLAAVCALVNNIIEIRSDAFKLCSGLQRPFGRRVDGIGQWQNVMEAMGVIAIIVNCYLIGQCGQLQRLIPWLGPESAIICIVVLEHFALLLKYIIHVVIPDIPGWVAEEMAKLEYQRREAFKKHERQAQHRYQQQQRRKREEEERQRHADYHARKERERGGEEGRSGQDSQTHEKNSSKTKPCGSQGGNTHDKPKRPSSLLASNNVLKLKQIIPLQSKFLSGTNAKSPQSPPGGDTKIPSFLSFKFLKSPETRREAAPERAHSPTKPFHPGKLFNFGKGEGQMGGNGLGTPISMQPRGATAVIASADGTVPGKSQLNGVTEDMPVDDTDDQGRAHKQYAISIAIGVFPIFPKRQKSRR
ncbi:unnamed protein product [Ranitomeya imitator]|uniref:Anoctamin n=1 Tax=Ranitomeya imitator TaxID=111125 RepID=A0ABN9KSX9_9NEOB|nr:unnamed protein product [Ranitomeya imitator]